MSLRSVLDQRRGPDIHDRSTVNIRSAPQMLEYRAIAARIAADRPTRVLDWGCGRGQMTRLLRDRGLEVTAFDYRPAADGQATVELEHFGVRADVSDEAVALPYEDSSFAAALSCGVLEHVADKPASLAELRRVLVPGGTLYVYKLPNRGSYLEWIARRLGLYHHGSNPLDTLYSQDSARALLAAAGFEVREGRYMNMLPLTLPGTIAARVARPLFALNRRLSAIPLLRCLATNVELVAVAPGERG